MFDERFRILCQAFDINDGIYDLDINILYEFALLFYKEKQGTRAMDLSYSNKLKLIAFIKQARLGSFKQNSDIGFLDFIGNDRKRAWESLRNMTKDNAMIEFIEHLVILCPSFVPFIKAQLANNTRNSRTGLRNPQQIIDFDSEESFNGPSTPYFSDPSICDSELKCNLMQSPELHLETYLSKRKFIDHDDLINKPSLLNYNGIHVDRELLSTDVCRLDLMKQELREAFLKQIKPMLQKLLEIQFPGDEPKQNDFLEVIGERQLEQLFVGCTNPLLNSEIYSKDLTYNKMENITNFRSHSDEGSNELPLLELPSLWTKKCTIEFKESLKSDSESIIEVGSGEIVTVRVPTHEDGSCLFWEFTTDYYDIGFGIFFEWLVKGFCREDTINEESLDTVFDDEAKEDYIEIDSSITPSNVEYLERADNPIEEVIQLSRVNSHEAVQCGSHIYHSSGVYLLKFDNSYSLLRSKKVYYRIFYTV